MRPVDWDRWSAASGFAFVAAIVLGLLLVRNEPSVDASAEEVTAWLGGDRPEILAAALVFGVSVVFLIWFAAAVANALGAAGEARLAVTALGGASVFAAMLVTTVAIVAGLAYDVEAIDSELAGGLFTVHWAFHVMAWFPIAVLIGSTSIAARRRKLFGIWYRLGSEVVAVGVLLAGTTWAGEGLWAPDGLYPMIASAAALGWVLVTSGLLLRGRWPQAAAQA